MSFYLVSDTGVVHGSSKVSQMGSIRQDFLQIVNGRWESWKTDGTQSVLEVGKQVRNWLFVDDLDENDLLSQGVIEWVHVDEVNGRSVVMIDFGDLEVAWVMEKLTWGEKRFFVVDVPVHVCILDFKKDFGADVVVFSFHSEILKLLL